MKSPSEPHANQGEGELREPFPPVEPDTDEELTSASELIRSLLKVIKTFKLYESNNPMLTKQLEELAAKFKVEALSVLTVSDSLATGEHSTAEQREKGFTLMAEIAFEIAP